MELSFDDIELAFNFVSGSEYGLNAAYLSLQDGKIYYESGYGDSDEILEELLGSDNCISIPHKNDLEAWYTYEEQASLSALRDWAKDSGLSLKG